MTKLCLYSLPPPYIIDNSGDSLSSKNTPANYIYLESKIVAKTPCSV